MSCEKDYCDIQKSIKAGEYQEAAMKGNDGRDSYRLGEMFRYSFERKVDIPQLLNGLLGLSGECGEVVELFKKWIFQMHSLDDNEAKRELGDVCWYIALICDAMNWSMDEILEMNMEKVKNRYPEGFDPQRSIERSEDDV